MAEWSQRKEAAVMFSKSSVVGDCIRAERRRAGLSQDQLAERLHVTRQTISNWEGGVSQS